MLLWQIEYCFFPNWYDKQPQLLLFHPRPFFDCTVHLIDGYNIDKCIDQHVLRNKCLVISLLFLFPF